MKKTSLLVLNLTVAGLLEIEIAAAQEATPGSSDDPRARASPADSRLRLGVEQTVATIQRYRYADGDAGETAVGWGLGSFDLAADFRAIDRFEIGLAVGLSGSHWTNDAGGTAGRLQLPSAHERRQFVVLGPAVSSLEPRLENRSWSANLKANS